MLSIYFGDHDDEIYDPATYFLNQYEDEWITDELSEKMIQDVDRSKVVGAHIIESPVLGAITPRELSGGVKTLILLAFDDGNHIFNASACGDNCAPWIEKIASEKDIRISLHHIMHFGEDVEAMILNEGKAVKGFREYLMTAIKYV